MKKIIYYVAISLDGFISGAHGDCSAFKADGEGVDKYLSDLKDFETVIMGRHTYEFGYAFGLKPGQQAYPHMQHHIFSSTLTFKDHSDQVQIHTCDLSVIDDLKKTSKTDIYLCGGGQFAGWLLDNDRIDVLKVKINPLILGEGIPLFGSSKKVVQLRLTESLSFADELIIATYILIY